MVKTALATKEPRKLKPGEVQFLNKSYKERVLAKRYPYFVASGGSVFFTVHRMGFRVLWDTLEDNIVKVANI